MIRNLLKMGVSLQRALWTECLLKINGKLKMFKSESSTYGGRVSSIKTFSTLNISVTKQYEREEVQFMVRRIRFVICDIIQMT